MKLMLVTDLDNTLVGDKYALNVLNHRLKAMRSEVCLVYATGRSYASANQLMMTANLLPPDYWIVGVGSEIYARDTLDRVWADTISQNWDRQAVWEIAKQFPHLSLQPQSEQNPWKLSFFLEQLASPTIIDDLQTQLVKANLFAQVIFSSGRDLDILPQGSNKGNAATYLQKNLQIPPEITLVCGDSGNDISLFQQSARGVIVGNAQPELLAWYYKHSSPWHYLARSTFANGILEAIKHYIEI